MKSLTYNSNSSEKKGLNRKLIFHGGLGLILFILYPALRIKKIKWIFYISFSHPLFNRFSIVFITYNWYIHVSLSLSFFLSHLFHIFSIITYNWYISLSLSLILSFIFFRLFSIQWLIHTSLSLFHIILIVFITYMFSLHITYAHISLPLFLSFFHPLFHYFSIVFIILHLSLSFSHQLSFIFFRLSSLHLTHTYIFSLSFSHPNFHIFSNVSITYNF